MCMLQRLQAFFIGSTPLRLNPIDQAAGPGKVGIDHLLDEDRDEFLSSAFTSLSTGDYLVEQLMSQGGKHHSPSHRSNSIGHVFHASLKLEHKGSTHDQRKDGCVDEGFDDLRLAGRKLCQSEI